MNNIVVHSNGSQQLIYYPHFFERSHFGALQNQLPWQQNEIRVFGKLHNEPRLTCWFGPAYKYSSIQWPEAAFPELINEIKLQLQTVTDFSFNAVLANFYRNGDDSMGWHSDNEKEMDSSCIASVSIGAERVLKFKSRSDKKTLFFSLPHGSLLVMNNFQANWQHAIGKVKSASPRINFTFRKIYC
jgi:alkylated DNA repair dioxygenase AlkB